MLKNLTLLSVLVLICLAMAGGVSAKAEDICVNGLNCQWSIYYGSQLLANGPRFVDTEDAACAATWFNFGLTTDAGGNLMEIDLSGGICPGGALLSVHVGQLWLKFHTGLQGLSAPIKNVVLNMKPVHVHFAVPRLGLREDVCNYGHTCRLSLYLDEELMAGWEPGVSGGNCIATWLDVTWGFGPRASDQVGINIWEGGCPSGAIVRVQFFKLKLLLHTGWQKLPHFGLGYYGWLGEQSKSLYLALP